MKRVSTYYQPRKTFVAKRKTEKMKKVQNIKIEDLKMTLIKMMEDEKKEQIKDSTEDLRNITKKNLYQTGKFLEVAY